MILKTHPNDDIEMDFFYIQGALYLLLRSGTITFMAIIPFNRIKRVTKKGAKKITYNRGPKDIIAGVEKFVALFKNIGFKVNTAFADNEFQKMEERFLVPMEICAAGQHVPIIERSIRTVKDRTICFGFHYFLRRYQS